MLCGAVLCYVVLLSAHDNTVFFESSSTQHKRKIAGCQHGGVCWGTVLSCSSLLLHETHTQNFQAQQNQPAAVLQVPGRSSCAGFGLLRTAPTLLACRQHRECCECCVQIRCAFIGP
jgi:hypothetical protein